MAFAGIDRLVYPGDTLMKRLFDDTNLFWTGFYFPVGGEVASKLTWRGKFTLLKGQGWGVAPLYVGKQMLTKAQKEALRKQAAKEHRPFKPLEDDPLWADLEGAKDGLQAAEFARAESMPRDTVIYLDVEFAGTTAPLPHYFLPYQAEWAKSVAQEGFRPGLYCSSMNAQKHADAADSSLGRKDVWAATWVAGPLPHGTREQARAHRFAKLPENPPGGSGFARAAAWQFGHGCNLVADVIDPRTKNPAIILGSVDLNSSIHRDPGHF